MFSKHFSIFLVFLFLTSYSIADTTSWVKSGYYFSSNEIEASEIKSTLFTHLLCAFAFINSTDYSIFINDSEYYRFESFTRRVKLQNPSVTSLLSIYTGGENSSLFNSLINQSSYTKSFIDSSIRTARQFDFQGIDLCGAVPKQGKDLVNFATLLKEWRVAITSEASNTKRSELVLVMTALYGSSDWENTDSGIKEWRKRGFSSNKLVIGLPYHGYAWTLVKPGEGGVGRPTSGPAFTMDGSMAYKFIKSYIRGLGDGVVSRYNDTFVVNYFTVASTWVNFDDVEAIKEKVSYAKKNGLLGYCVFQVGNDDNWVLSTAAHEVNEDHHNRNRRLLIVVLVTALTATVLLGMVFFCYYHKGTVITITRMVYRLRIHLSAPDEDLNENGSNLIVFDYLTIKLATSYFSKENKVGEGGFGAVYKGKLGNGVEIAVKRLSKTSKQGLEEFKNEITLTAKLQHVNLVRLLGYCTKRNEKLLIYEYLPNKSLDHFLIDPRKSILLDWKRRVNIIEGITQGLLYLQEYSNFTIIHRDIKASNVLLDHEMNPKISDFGMAKLFEKYELEANTSRIVGTYGYVPPEYVRKGIYSPKYDVYSFGVLLLQIISGKRTSRYYGPHENMNLLEYAYELWMEGRGMEFVDPSLDDSTSHCKIMRCMQVALLCVQENSEDRPSMLEVDSLLKNESAYVGTPNVPAFSMKKLEEDKVDTLKSGFKFSSINDVTISQMLPR